MFEVVLKVDYYYLLGAGVAQLVEQLICNQPVGGSTPLASSNSPRKSLSHHYLLTCNIRRTGGARVCAGCIQPCG